jgi:hypothetical protein
VARAAGDDYKPGLDNPAPDAVAVTPDDNTDLPLPARGLYIGGDGDVSIVTLAGSVVTFQSVLAPFVLPQRCTRVRSTGTTATKIVAFL